MEMGKTIARLRKGRNMTQEELGQAVGVSGQAVSKWENGGTPDTELLPAIADRLGVTIDTLYGREDRPARDMGETLLRWLGSIPVEQRMNELFRLLCQTFQRPYYMDDETLADLMNALCSLPIKSCYSTDVVNHTEERLWLRSDMELTEGLQLGIPAEDCPMFLLLPEPEMGYEANFADNEAYRGLFAALALPGALEILRCLYARKQAYYSAEAIGKASGVDAAATETALKALETCHLLKQTEVNLADAPLAVYELRDSRAFVPFLLLARWLQDKNEAFICRWVDRKEPILRKDKEKHENE